MNQSNVLVRVIFNKKMFGEYLIATFLLCKYLFAANIIFDQ